MRLSSWFVLSAVAGALLSATACQVGCIEDGSGTTCTAKSLDRFDGAASPPVVVERAPGAPVTIDVIYGSILVQRSATPKIEAQFSPFCYAGHDEKASADQQLAQNLVTQATGAGAVTISVQRQGGTNGLGANVVVRLPDSFDGPLNIVNHGDGPLNEFDVKVETVGRAVAVNVTNQSQLGGCWISGAPSVRSTKVDCGEDISVFDVSDEVNITNSESMHDAEPPAITLRVAGVSPGSRGGRIVSASGSILATFPRAGGYVVDAKSPVRGSVQGNAAGPGCTLNGNAPNAKVLTCGNGPRYEVIAGASPNHPGQPPPDNNVVLAQQ
jgi:hypothetical protein